MAKRVVPLPFPAPLVSSPEAFGAAVRSARASSGMTLEETRLRWGLPSRRCSDLRRERRA